MVSLKRGTASSRTCTWCARLSRMVSPDISDRTISDTSASAYPRSCWSTVEANRSAPPRKRGATVKPRRMPRGYVLLALSLLPLTLLSAAEPDAPRAFVHSPTRTEATQLRGGAGAFNAARKGGRRHSGVDIVANQSSPDPWTYEVYAVREGIVAYARPNESEDGGYGYTVVLDHGDGYYTLYAHLARFASADLPALKVGDSAPAGYVLGYIANLDTGELSSGNAKAKSVSVAEKIQLHIEVFSAPSGRHSDKALAPLKKGGGAIDPTPALQAMGYR